MTPRSTRGEARRRHRPRRAATSAERLRRRHGTHHRRRGLPLRRPPRGRRDAADRPARAPADPARPRRLGARLHPHAPGARRAQARVRRGTRGRRCAADAHGADGGDSHRQGGPVRPAATSRSRHYLGLAGRRSDGFTAERLPTALQSSARGAERGLDRGAYSSHRLRPPVRRSRERSRAAAAASSPRAGPEALVVRACARGRATRLGHLAAPSTRHCGCGPGAHGRRLHAVPRRLRSRGTPACSRASGR